MNMSSNSKVYAKLTGGALSTNTTFFYRVSCKKHRAII